MRTLVWSTLAGAALLLAACGGGDGSAGDGGDGGSGSGTAADKTSGAPDKAGGSGGSGGTGRRLNGSVCTLLTVAEVEAALKLGVPLTPTETGGRDEDRSCAYAMTVQGVAGAPALVVTLLGERDSVSGVAGYRQAYPRAVAVQVRGAEALQLDSSGPGVVVYKNGLLAYVQPVAFPQGETTLAIATKLAEPIAGRLP